MSRRTLNPKGFSLIEALVVIIVVAVLAGAGAYIYHRDHKAKNSNTVSNNNSASEKQTENTTNNKVDETAGWFQYDSPDGRYSIKLPDGWKLVSYHGDSSPYTVDAKNIIYTPGTKAVVANTDFAGDIINVAFAMGDAPSSNEPRGTKRLTFKTNQGLEVSRYDFYMANVPQFDDLPQGTTEYVYSVKDGDKNFPIVHDVLKGEKAQTALIEEAIKTLELK